MSAIDESVCRCEREPAWCFVHRRWGRALSSPPTRMELVEQARGLTATITAQAAEIARLRAALAVTQRALEAAHTGERFTVVDEIERLQRERDALRAAARECLDALEAPAPVWDADESEHDEHAARLEVARGALRALAATR